jgi:hypothetical protein
MSQLPNKQLARLLLDKIAEAITEIEVSNSFTLATAAQLITMDTIWPETRVAVWHFIEKVGECSTFAGDAEPRTNAISPIAFDEQKGMGDLWSRTS